MVKENNLIKECKYKYADLCNHPSCEQGDKCQFWMDESKCPDFKEETKKSK